jgi:hypothetical protein
MAQPACLPRAQFPDLAATASLRPCQHPILERCDWAADSDRRCDFKHIPIFDGFVTLGHAMQQIRIFRRPDVPDVDGRSFSCEWMEACRSLPSSGFSCPRVLGPGYRSGGMTPWGPARSGPGPSSDLRGLMVLVYCSMVVRNGHADPGCITTYRLRDKPPEEGPVVRRAVA